MATSGRRAPLWWWTRLARGEAVSLPQTLPHPSCRRRRRRRRHRRRHDRRGGQYADGTSTLAPAKMFPAAAHPPFAGGATGGHAPTVATPTTSRPLVVPGAPPPLDATTSHLPPCATAVARHAARRRPWPWRAGHAGGTQRPATTPHPPPATAIITHTTRPPSAPAAWLALDGADVGLTGIRPVRSGARGSSGPRRRDGPPHPKDFFF